VASQWGILFCGCKSALQTPPLSLSAPWQGCCYSAPEHTDNLASQNAPENRGHMFDRRIRPLRAHMWHNVR
jgi:hypothetical protein